MGCLVLIVAALAWLFAGPIAAIVILLVGILMAVAD